MERNLLIELLEDGDKVSLYSPHFEGEEYSEFEKFLLTYKDSYPDDVRQLVYRLDIIKRDGAADRHFRYEGTKRDRVMALPSHLETTSLRLYLLNIQAKILILDEPTRGIDVGAKYEIYCIINDLAAEGKCVVLISSELPEVLGMSDRIYIMNEARIVGEMKAEDATQENIMATILKSGRGA